MPLPGPLRVAGGSIAAAGSGRSAADKIGSCQDSMRQLQRLGGQYWCSLETL